MSPPSTRSAGSNSRLAVPVLHGIRTVQTAVNVNQTIGEALEDLRRRAIDNPVVYVYAIDDDDRLVGQVPTPALLFSSPSRLVRDVMQSDLTTIPIDMSLDEALEIFRKRRLLALPVVDREGRLVGAIDVEQYATGQLERAERERVRQVFQTLGVDLGHAADMTVLEALRMRLPWLLCNIGGGLLCAVIAWRFEDLLKQAVILAFFLPLVLTLGESIAMQSVTLAVGVDPDRRSAKAAFKAVRREALTALLLGLACGAIVALFSLLWGGGLAGAATMMLAVSGSMTFAAAAGGTIPLLLHSLRLDPTVAAGPVALVVADTAATGLYFSTGLFLLSA
jgi:magnesium transporter